MNKLEEIKSSLKWGEEVEGKEYAHKSLSLEDVDWLIKQVEKFRNLMQWKNSYEKYALELEQENKKLKDYIEKLNQDTEPIILECIELKEENKKLRKENFQLIEDRNLWIEGSKQQQKEIEELLKEIGLSKREIERYKFNLSECNESLK